MQDGHAVLFYKRTALIHEVTFLETNLRASSVPGNPHPCTKSCHERETHTTYKTPKDDQDKGLFPFNEKFQNFRERDKWFEKVCCKVF